MIVYNKQSLVALILRRYNDDTLILNTFKMNEK